MSLGQRVIYKKICIFGHGAKPVTRYITVFVTNVSLISRSRRCTKDKEIYHPTTLSLKKTTKNYTPAPLYHGGLPSFFFLDAASGISRPRNNSTYFTPKRRLLFKFYSDIIFIPSSCLFAIKHITRAITIIHPIR